MAREPGLDRHEWESEFASLEDDLRDDPAAGLPLFADLVERMLLERGYDVTDATARGGDEVAVVRDYLAAREVADRSDAGDRVDPGDIGAAIENLRELYEVVLGERSAP